MPITQPRLAALLFESESFIAAFDTLRRNILRVIESPISDSDIRAAIRAELHAASRLQPIETRIERDRYDRTSRRNVRMKEKMRLRRLAKGTTPRSASTAPPRSSLDDEYLAAMKGRMIGEGEHNAARTTVADAPSPRANIGNVDIGEEIV